MPLGSHFGPFLDPFRPLLGRPWASLGEALDLSWAPLGRSWGSLGRSWGALRALLGHSWDALGRSWGALGPILALLWSILGAPGRIPGPLCPPVRHAHQFSAVFLNDFRMIFLLEPRSCNHPLSISPLLRGGLCAAHGIIIPHSLYQ